VVERRRFLIEPAKTGETLSLGASESRHALRVLRLHAGQTIEAVDGSGWEYVLELKEGAGRSAAVKVLSKRRAARGWTMDVIVAVGVVKGARMDWAVEKAAELGARAFIPFTSERSAVVPDPVRSKLMRWRRVAAAALKQSLSPFLMRVPALRDFDYVAAMASRVRPALLAKEGAPRLAALPDSRRRKSPCLLVIGPEGGFSDDEEGVLRRGGALGFSLGPARLRTETAVVAGLAALWAASGADRKDA
jgi:16S rRNA (uracil1498-N3)-methyltransferase